MMKSEFFENNRLKLMEKLSGSIIVLTGYNELQRTHDEAHPFTQESNFWYLCGINQPGWRLIIDTKRAKSYAVMPSLSHVKQLFDGGLSPELAKQISAVDEVIDSEEADSRLRQLRLEHRLVYTVDEDDYLKQHAEFSLNPASKDLRTYLQHRFESVRDARRHVEDLRAIKQDDEVAAISKAATISAQAFKKLEEELPNLKYEYQAEALLSYEFRRGGADGHAYSPIVASGINACTLHYVDNNDRLSKRSALLIDAAASVDHYAADITRGFMISQPTKRQTEVYQAVKSVFDSCKDAIKPGLSFSGLQSIAEKETATALKHLGLSHDTDSVRKYFPHAISHSLGLDTHDTFGSHTELREGMVLTIEPGLYLPEEQLGIRYEDDFLITANGFKNLSGTKLGDVWYNKA